MVVRTVLSGFRFEGLNQVWNRGFSYHLQDSTNIEIFDHNGQLIEVMRVFTEKLDVIGGDYDIILGSLEDPLR